MCHIYQRASETLIWLGVNPGLEEVFAWLKAQVWDEDGSNIDIEVREQLAMLSMCVIHTGIEPGLRKRSSNPKLYGYFTTNGRSTGESSGLL
jgi:hypothetical protein